MSKTRDATETVAFVDDYCAAYRDLFSDVRSFEYFKLLHGDDPPRRADGAPADDVFAGMA